MSSTYRFICYEEELWRERDYEPGWNKDEEGSIRVWNGRVRLKQAPRPCHGREGYEGITVEDGIKDRMAWRRTTRAARQRLANSVRLQGESRYSNGTLARPVLFSGQRMS
jgi:hypothetical protein